MVPPFSLSALLLILSDDFGSSHTDLLLVVTQASTNALPVPMLRQVYVKPCEGPVRGPRAPRRGPKGSQEDPQGGSKMVILRGRSSKNGKLAMSTPLLNNIFLS